MFEIKVSGKLNLYLDILSTRADGYHEIDTIMQSIDIYDTLRITLAEENTVFCPQINQEKNTAYRAAKLFFERTGIKGGVHVDIQKGIPLKAGMGGSSSDAAGLLVALNRIYGEPFDKEALIGIAKEIGADVPFLLFGGCMRCRGIGEKLQTVPNNLDPYYLILRPDGGVDAGTAYQRYDGCGGKNGNLPLFLEGLEKGDVGLFKTSTANSLEKACIALCPPIDHALRYLHEKAKIAFMTGSGSACVGVFQDRSAAEDALSGAAGFSNFSKIATNTRSSVIFSQGF